MILITIPDYQPDNAISRNGRGTWNYAKAARAAREVGQAYGLASGQRLLRVRRVDYGFYGQNPRRDIDNMVTAMKPVLDGICDALGCEDNDIERITASRHRPVLKGKPCVDVWLYSDSESVEG